MDGLKGFAEIAEHILYETLGLVIPGAVFVLAVAFAVDPAHGQRAVELAQRHPWLALGGAYVLGYPVQSLSRPLTTVFEWLLQRPARLLAAMGWLLGATARRAVGERVAAFEAWLLRRHAHHHARDARDAHASRADPVAGAGATASERVAFAALLHDRWARRLELSTESRLTEQQVKDLCYSALSGDERKSLIRFRAAASLTRGVATAAVVVTTIVAATLVRQPARLSWSAVGVIQLLIVAFYALMERGDMYDRLWSAVLQSQALGVGAHTRCPPPAPEHDPSSAVARAPMPAREAEEAAEALAASRPNGARASIAAAALRPSAGAATPPRDPGEGVAISPTTAHLPSSSTRTTAIAAGGASPSAVPKE